MLMGTHFTQLAKSSKGLEASFTTISQLTKRIMTNRRMKTMNKLLLFEYGCPECGLGTVRTTRVQNYKTKIKGYPFVVDEAFIGVCDHCKAEHFASTETKHWEQLFYNSLEQRQA